ncbi:hypothetical protein WJX74_001742 [Apatococcus lobatus]|uniref:Arf-GAP domain-containing protein n=1 Tax=Apatococcus lobatus TaxID=904363 RepID=A0AAW1RIW4_9CHLO
MTARNLEAKHDKLLKELLRKPENKRCANCEVLGPQYVVLDFSTFVCTDCSGAHRQFHHRVKGISMATFKPEEMKAIQQGGNQEAASAFLSKWTPSELAKPTDRNPQKIRDWIDAVYVKKRFHGPKKLQRPSPSPSTGTLSARSSARSTRDDDIPTRSMADIMGNDSIKLQISPATSTTSNTPSLMDPTPVAAPSPAMSRTAPSAAADPFGIGTSDGGPPTAASSQTNWSPFDSVDSSTSQALQPSPGSGPSAYAPPGAPSWSAFDAPANGPSTGPAGGLQQQQQSTASSQQPSGVGGASWDPFSASGPPTANPSQQQQPTSAPAPTQPPQQQQQQPSLMEAVRQAEQRAGQAASQQRPQHMQQQLQPTAAGAGGSWQAFGAPASGQAGPQASGDASPGQSSMKELPLDLFAEPTPRGIPGYNHPSRGGYGAPQPAYPGTFPGAPQGFPGAYPGFPGGQQQQQFPGMQPAQGMFPYGQGMMTPNGLMQPRPGMAPQGIPGMPQHMMGQTGYGSYPPQQSMPGLPNGNPGTFVGQNGFPGQSNYPGGFPGQQPGGFPGQAGFPGQQRQQQLPGYGGPLSNSITGEYRGQFPPGTPGGPPPGINPSGPETMDPFSGLVPGLKSALPNPSTSASQNAAAAGLQPPPASFGLSNGSSARIPGGQSGPFGSSQAGPAGFPQPAGSLGVGPAGGTYPGVGASMPVQQSSLQQQQQQQHPPGPGGYPSGQPQRPPQQQPAPADPFGYSPSMSPLANGPTSAGPSGKWATQHPYGLNPLSNNAPRPQHPQQGPQQPLQQTQTPSHNASAQHGLSGMGLGTAPQQQTGGAAQNSRVAIPQIPVGGPPQQTEQQQQDPDYDPFAFVPSASTLATASPKNGPQPQSAQSPTTQTAASLNPLATSSAAAAPLSATSATPPAQSPTPAPAADQLTTSPVPVASRSVPQRPAAAAAVAPPGTDLLGGTSTRGPASQAAAPLPNMSTALDGPSSAAAPPSLSTPASALATQQRVAPPPAADLLGGPVNPASTRPNKTSAPHKSAPIPDEIFSGFGGAAPAPAAPPPAAVTSGQDLSGLGAFGPGAPSQAAPPPSSGNPFG